MADYTKVKSVSKVINTRGDKLNAKVLDTLHTIASIVGSTLGPGGMPVLIERQEFGLPGLVTKDGVTVFRSLGFQDPVSHSIMESARDAAIRTVSEAGDGTTTATVLAEAIVRHMHQYLRDNPNVSPQAVVRKLERVFRTKIEPEVHKLSKTAALDTEEGRNLLKAVATVSANGDTELAEAVMECFDIVGDAGNVAIVEQSGPSSYKVEKIDGYPIPIGYEESCIKFATMFLNDKENQRVSLEKPYFVLYHGVLQDIQVLVPFLNRVAKAWNNTSEYEWYDPNMTKLRSPNVVLMATGFGESVLGSLALNFAAPDTINVVPVLTPKSAILNSELHLLEDIAAVTGAAIFNPLSRPLDMVSPDIADDLGSGEAFEMSRFRATIVGHNDPEEVEDRAEQLQNQIRNAESELDRRLLQERLAKLTGGIAKLRVVGASNGELREKKDRADDAVCAVRGAIKHGVVPGGGWLLTRLAQILTEGEEVILAKAFAEPVRKLYTNIGFNAEDAEKFLGLLWGHVEAGENTTFDCLKDEWVDAFEGGILDSTPAVLEAVRNSISIASLLGTLGGVVVFPRDLELERRESSANSSFLRDIEAGEYTQAQNERG